jgi:hypothetical protein
MAFPFLLQLSRTSPSKPSALFVSANESRYGYPLLRVSRDTILDVLVTTARERSLSHLLRLRLFTHSPI